MSTETKGSLNLAASGGPSNRDWWPNQLGVTRFLLCRLLPYSQHL